MPYVRRILVLAVDNQYLLVVRIDICTLDSFQMVLTDESMDRGSIHQMTTEVVFFDRSLLHVDIYHQLEVCPCQSTYRRVLICGLN